MCFHFSVEYHGSVVRFSPAIEPPSDAQSESSKSTRAAIPATERQVQDESLFCADSDESDEETTEGDSLSSAPNGGGKFIIKRVQQHEEVSDSSTQYPCTICRRSSLVNELIRCQNCPRYFHLECVEKEREGGHDPARRRFCPKCARNGPGPSSGILSAPIARPKKVVKKRVEKVEKLTLTVVKYRRNADSVVDVGDWAKSCPGCGRVSMDVKKKREQGEEYSIYCNVDCVMKTARKTRRALKGQEDERVLVMDTTIGNVLEKKQSPFLRNFSSWLRKHQKCYPVLPEPDDNGHRSMSPDEGTPKSKEPQAPKPIVTTIRLSAPASVVDSESRKSYIGSSTDSPKISRSGSTADQTAPVDPGRLNVRKALRDVLLLRYVASVFYQEFRY